MNGSYEYYIIHPSRLKTVLLQVNRLYEEEIKEGCGGIGTRNSRKDYVARTALQVLDDDTNW